MKQIDRQRGSVMTFTVVGVVLVILALGLLYSARQQDNNSVVPVATDNNSQKQELAQKDEKADQNKSETAKPNTTNTQSNNSQKQEQPKNQSTGNAQKPSATQQPAPTTPTGPATPAAPAAATANGGNAANLPTTGPADHIGELLVVGVIPGMAVAYFRSRKVV